MQRSTTTRQLWATPLIQTVVAGQAFNEEFEEYVLELRENSEGITKSNVGGWHSQDDLMQWPLPRIGELRNWMMDGVRSAMEACAYPEAGQRRIDFQLVAWANVTRRGGFHLPHTHPNSSWSGVYYVKTGEDSLHPMDRGPIVFMDPRGPINQFNWPGNPFEQMIRIDPEPGMLLVFPSWLKHFVHPFNGDTERISVSFNLVITEHQDNLQAPT